MIFADPASFMAFLRIRGKFPSVGKGTADVQNSVYLHIVLNSFSARTWLLGSRNRQKNDCTTITQCIVRIIVVTLKFSVFCLLYDLSQCPRTNINEKSQFIPHRSNISKK